MINLLIIGADSILGSNLINYLSLNSKFRLYVTTRKKEKINSRSVYLDLNDPKSFIIPENIDFAIIFSYLGGVSLARENPIKTHTINVVNTLEIIMKLHERKIHTIYPSTNLFHSNLEFSLTKNIYNDYVTQKLKVQDKILSLGSFGTVIRSSKVIHHKFQLFQGWVENFSKKTSVSAFDDVLISPVWIDDYLNLITRIILNKINGDILISSNDQISYHDAGIKICESLGLNKNFVIKIKAASTLHKDDIFEGEYLNSKNYKENSTLTGLVFESNYVIQSYLKSNNYTN
jgi:dTDP-4-dehydrorhamnose reductase